MYTLPSSAIGGSNALPGYYPTATAADIRIANFELLAQNS